MPSCRAILNKAVHKGAISANDMKKIERNLCKWIPVTERLPEYGQRVLVTYDLVKKYPWVNILRYGKPMFEDKPCFYEADSEWGDVPYDGIVAWMPLPEPYREEVADE